MQKFTTVNLRMPSPRRWFDLPTPIAAAICLVLLVSIGLVLGKIHSAPVVAMQPTPALSYIILSTSAPAVPTATPAPPTPDERVYQELAALRAQVAQLQAQQAAAQQPQVVYVPAPAEQSYQTTSEQQPEQAAPTPEPPAPAMQPQTAAILDRGAWAAMAATAKAGK